MTRVDNQLVEIIDVEKILAEVAPTSEAISVGVVDAEATQGGLAAGADGGRLLGGA